MSTLSKYLKEGITSGRGSSSEYKIIVGLSSGKSPRELEKEISNILQRKGYNVKSVSTETGRRFSLGL